MFSNTPLIGSIVISLSRGCLPNDEGPGPQIFFFLEPPLHFIHLFLYLDKSYRSLIALILPVIFTYFVIFST